MSLNSQRIKPATNVKVGDTINVQRGIYELEMTVLNISEQRGSASIAQALYQETDQSIKRRESLKQQLANQPKVQIDRHKPDKRGVRTNRRLKRGE